MCNFENIPLDFFCDFSSIFMNIQIRFFSFTTKSKSYLHQLYFDVKLDILGRLASEM